MYKKNIKKKYINYSAISTKKPVSPLILIV